jgi:hypothetical protein
MDDRAEKHATVITAQLPIEHWHGWIGDATILTEMYLRRVSQF